MAAASASQAGVLTRCQAELIGISRHRQRRLVDQGYWQRLASGVFLTHHLPADFTALAWAGLLRAGDSARLGGLAAGHLHRLTEEAPSAILILQPHSGQRGGDPRWRYRREREGARRAGSVGSPPRTTIEDTVLDLCDPGMDESAHDPVHWITVAVGQRRTTAARLRRTLQIRQRHPRRAELVELLSEVSEGVRSPLERYYRRDVERAHDLPVSTLQSADRLRTGRIFRDVRYRRYGVVVELDGRPGHEGTGRFRDFRRDNETVVGGEVTLRYGWQDIRSEPCRVAAQVAEMLIRGGWSGLPTRCPRCRTAELVIG